MKKKTFLSTIPFAGFYCTLHEDEIDQTFVRMFEDDNGNPAPGFITDKARDAVSWSFVYHAYAKDYAASFLHWLGMGGKFESMESPRYYNFETDRIFVELTGADIARAWHNTDRGIFTRHCRERFTSRGGFISSYDPDWKTWGPLSTWDHNQIGTLIGAFAETEQGGEFDSWAEYGLMEDASGNGDIDNWIWNNAGPDLARCANAWYYLRDRAQRKVKTLAQWHAARRAENRPFAGTPLGAWCGA